MRNGRALYVWILILVFFLSLYNFLSIALLKLEEFNTINSVVIQQQDLSENRTSSPKVLSKAGDKNVFVRKSVNEFVGLDISEEDDYAIRAEPKIFWGVDVMNAIPKVSKDIDTCEEFSRKLQALKIKHIEPATFPKCGRPDNAFAAMEDNTQLCVRYRHPHDYLISGEILSFHLAKYLGINVPCVSLSSTGADDGDKSKWPVDIRSLKWDKNKNVAFIQWIPNLSTNLQMPKYILSALETKTPIRYYDVHGKSLRFRSTLAQWGDMFIFDYIIGHHDRFARLQDDSEKERRPSVLRNIIPNLGNDPNGLLWIFDNEPGLLDAYELMYPQYRQENVDSEAMRFLNFHNQTLRSMCVFRKSLLLSIIRLYQKNDPVDHLLGYVKQREPNLHLLNLNADVKYDKYLKKHFRRRLADVIAHSKWCSDTQDTQSFASDKISKEKIFSDS